MLGDASDGDPSRRPKRDISGHFEPADEEMVRHWKKAIAVFLIRESGKVPYVSTQEYILRDLPAGYQLFVQKKGSGEDLRTDAYLYGSKYVNRFRSPAEFYFHAKWIDHGCPINSKGKRLCGCAYCDKTRNQKEISELWSPKYTKPRKQSRTTSASRGRIEGAVDSELAAKDYRILGDRDGMDSAPIQPVFPNPDLVQAQRSSTTVRGIVTRIYEGVGGASWRN